ncbi:uncharacterized protein LOC135681191 isoform X2 [Rhopilema esculentum]|uniref:uncharacterized protein LOC135681191 isoform X2 n=1 Tax=Rhopilema esculentum TaxID=499914 RepID=UPI0031D371E5
MDQLPFKHIDGSISIPCTKCDEYVDVQKLQEHREAHRVWKIFRCNAETVPKTTKQLLKKRRNIINEAIGKADPNRPVPVKVLQKIDWAFEKIRKTISDDKTGFIQDTRSKLNENIAAKNYQVAGTSSKLKSSGQAVGVCHSQNERWRTIDEDRYTFKESCLGTVEHGFFGVFDGYNNAVAADKCSKHFYDILIKQIVKTNSDFDYHQMSEDQIEKRIELVKEALKACFHEMDSYLLIEDIMPDFSDVDVLREHLLKQELGNRPKGQNDQMAKIDEISVDQVQSERDNQDILAKKESKSKRQADFTSNIIGQNGNLDEGENAVEIEVDQTFEGSLAESNISSESSSTDIRLPSPNSGEQSYTESKACFLARALVERLVYSALLAGSHENITAMVVLLNGCPINLYLLPEVKRKSVVQRIISKIE